jgi:hypothetical protein
MRRVPHGELRSTSAIRAGWVNSVLPSVAGPMHTRAMTTMQMFRHGRLPKLDAGYFAVFSTMAVLIGALGATETAELVLGCHLLPIAYAITAVYVVWAGLCVRRSGNRQGPRFPRRDPGDDRPERDPLPRPTVRHDVRELVDAE